MGASFFGIEMSFLWYRDGLSLLFGIEISFGIEILHSVVQHLDRLLPGINLSLLFWASTSLQIGVKEDVDTKNKIEHSRCLKKDISIPTKRVTRLE